MPRGKKGTRTVKDKWAKLPEEFKEQANTFTEEDLRKLVAKIGLDQNALMLAKKQDVDLASKAEEYKEAGKMYREGTALNKLKIAYIHAMLNSKGCNVPTADDFLRKSADDLKEDEDA